MKASEFTTQRLQELIRDDRVHRDIYRDPAIFELEMTRIFGRAWVYVCHESQVPEPGSFITTTVGGQPIVVVRDREDQVVHALYNRCGHRGALVCNEPCGTARHFRCCYHGWTFRTNGSVLSIPQKTAYEEGFERSDRALGMVPVECVDSYRGFVFVRMTREGPDLKTFLGPMTRAIDDIIALSPVGEVALTGGVHKYRYHGNWKVQLDNFNDLYHPTYSHESTTSGGRQFARQAGAKEGGQFANEEGEAISFWDETGVWAFDNGHGYCGRIPAAGARGGEPFKRYCALLEATHGKERTEQILTPIWHNAVFYPNLNIQSQAQHVRVVVPISVDCTDVYVYPILLKGAPDEINQDVIRYLNITHAAASLIQTDDLEAFRRINEGLKTQGSDWVMMNRFFGRDRQQERSWSGYGTSELELRNQAQAWKRYMTF